MSNLDRGVEYTDFSTAMRFILHQWRKRFYTAMPGIVQKYDQATKRAIIRPAIQIQYTDDSLHSRPLLVNVPVIWPGGSKYVLHFPLEVGDTGMLLFSMRGIGSFKDTYEESPPDPGHFLDLNDPVFLPVFGALGITPTTDNGPALQKEDGTVSIHIDEDNVVVKVPEGKNVHLGDESGQTLATETFVRDIFNRHIHSTAVGPSGPPIRPTLLRHPNLTTKTKGR